MGDAADLLYEQECAAWESHLLGLCGEYGICQYCEDEENRMQGIIQQAKASKSGKTLSVQVNGQWYTSKHFELSNMVGQEITFTSSVQEFPDGGSCTWLNDYTVAGVSTTPAGQAFDQAHAQNIPPPMGSPVPPVPPNPVQQTTQAPQRPAVDRDASITALALTKCIQGITSTDVAFAAYKDLYNKVLEWNPDHAKRGDFDDSIPY